ncbi:hypothetical protein L6452_37261 [Arctium lappa]|uniref:Uncharacterized protein n=1 Tax=Arctium lappa TaxID=4217 RepID=A0ACB8Y3J2_ARCLA|nr:hypothetical protein L6452_37261 [Arctium lappa]
MVLINQGEQTFHKPKLLDYQLLSIDFTSFCLYCPDLLEHYDQGSLWTIQLLSIDVQSFCLYNPELLEHYDQEKIHSQQAPVVQPEPTASLLLPQVISVQDFQAFTEQIKSIISESLCIFIQNDHVSQIIGSAKDACELLERKLQKVRQWIRFNVASNKIKETMGELAKFRVKSDFC